MGNRPQISRPWFGDRIGPEDVLAVIVGFDVPGKTGDRYPFLPQVDGQQRDALLRRWRGLLVYSPGVVMSNPEHVRVAFTGGVGTIGLATSAGILVIDVGSGELLLCRIRTAIRDAWFASTLARWWWRFRYG